MESNVSPGSRWLTFPRVLCFSLVAALGLSLLMVQPGFCTDDFVYLGIISGRDQPGPLPHTAFDLFRYTDGTPETLTQLVNRGVYPWWSLPELRLAFWRPLSSALLVLDYHLFGKSSTGYQLHSILWYLASIATAALLFRRVLPGLAATLAVLLFALDEAHSVPVGWISNRNALVSAVPAMLGLWMHLEWREKGRKWAMPLSVLGLALGLAGGEGALGYFAYLGFYELLGNKRPLRERLMGLVPAVLLGLAYTVAYKLLGYGAYGSDFYVDPARQPGAWLSHAVTRVPALVSGVLLSLPSDLEPLGGMYAAGLAVGAVVGLALVGWLVRAAWPGLEEQHRLHLRWLMAGAAISVLPVASTLPGNRLLMTPSLGGAAVLAVALTQLWRWRERAWRPRALAVGAAMLVLLHLVAAPYMWWKAADIFMYVSARSERTEVRLAKHLDPAKLANQRVVMLAAADNITGMYSAVHWWAQGHVLPRAWWTLSFNSAPHRVTRTGPNTLEMELEHGRYTTSPVERLYRSANYPLVQGTEVDLQGLKMKVLEADAEGPRKLQATFDAPLEDPSLVLLYWKNNNVERLDSLPVGGQLRINYWENPPT